MTETTQPTPADNEHRQRVDAVRVAIEALLAENNLTLSDVFPHRRGGKRGPKPGTKVAPKYQHPSQPDLVWSGRGKTPVWLRSLEGEGRARQEFLIARQG